MIKSRLSKIQAVCVIYISISLLSPLTNCGPLRQILPDIAKQDHQIDNLNEIHKDADAKDPELVQDVLPDQNNNAIPAEVDNGQEHESDNDDLKFDLEDAKKFQKLPAEKIDPPDHLDVVKMEQDGESNKEYHKEMFLGEQHDEFKEDTVDDAEAKLKEIVSKADLNSDGFLSKKEMEKWILEKMMEHFEEAKQETGHIFKHLDPDGDGFIKWKEYYVHFLLSRGFDVENAFKHVIDYGDSLQLDSDDKDALATYKFRWTDADKNPIDNKLNQEEFMVFRHPEHSKDSLNSMASNVMHGIDSNADGIITEEEFSELPPGEVEGKEFEEMDKKWQEERREEFKEIIDTNHDGKVDLQELKNYLDPTNPLQAKLEADTLMSLIDDDKDNLLSMDEIMKHSDIFISSKIMNFAANVHDEF